MTSWFGSGRRDPESRDFDTRAALDTRPARKSFAAKSNPRRDNAGSPPASCCETTRKRRHLGAAVPSDLQPFAWLKPVRGSRASPRAGRHQRKSSDIAGWLRENARRVTRESHPECVVPRVQLLRAAFLPPPPETPSMHGEDPPRKRETHARSRNSPSFPTQ